MPSAPSRKGFRPKETALQEQFLQNFYIGAPPCTGLTFGPPALSVGDKATTIYAVGGAKITEVWSHEQQVWALAPPEYNIKKARDFFGVLAVSRNFVC